MARRPVTPIVLGVFMLMASAVAAASAVTLLAPGTPLDGIWRIKPAEYARLRALGDWVGFGFVALSAVAATGGFGVIRRRRWGWWVAVIGISLNGLADAGRIPLGAVLEGLIGVSITALILFWLTRQQVAALFTAGDP